MQGEAVQGDVEVEVGSGDGEDYGGMNRGGVMTGGTGLRARGYGNRHGNIQEAEGVQLGQEHTRGEMGKLGAAQGQMSSVSLPYL